MTKTIPLILALTACAVSPAIAQERHAVRVKVRAGETATLTTYRIEQAAMEACGASSFSLIPVKDAVRSGACWRDAVADAKDQLTMQAGNRPAAGGQ